MKVFIAGTADLSRAARQSFLARGGCEVLDYDPGANLVERAAAERPDLIVLGPGEGHDPTDLYRRLRDDSATSGIPVVLLLEGGGGADQPDEAWPAAETTDAILDRLAARLEMRRREHPRRPLRVKVDFYEGDDEGVAHTRDLSVGGMFLRMDEPPRPGTRLQLIFGLPGPECPTVRALGEVVRRQEAEPGPGGRPAGCGIRFARVGQRDLDAIARAVRGSIRGEP